MAWSNHLNGHIMVRIPGSLQKAPIPSPTAFNHLTGRLWRTTVEAEEVLEAVEDLLRRGSSSFCVSESPCFDDLNIVKDALVSTLD